MAPEPLKKPDTAAFPANKIAPFLRAVMDPEGKGDLTPAEVAALRQVEENSARRSEAK